MFPTFTLSPQFGQLCKPSTQVKLEHEARKNWDLFYKRNTTHFFKDRHWLTREFPQLVEANNVSPNIPADQSPNYFISMIFLTPSFYPQHRMWCYTLLGHRTFQIMHYACHYFRLALFPNVFLLYVYSVSSHFRGKMADFMGLKSGYVHHFCLLIVNAWCFCLVFTNNRSK